MEDRGGQAGLVEIGLALGIGRAWGGAGLARGAVAGRRGRDTAGARRRWSPLALAIEYRVLQKYVMAIFGVLNARLVDV